MTQDEVLETPPPPPPAPPPPPPPPEPVRLDPRDLLSALEWLAASGHATFDPVAAREVLGPAPLDATEASTIERLERCCVATGLTLRWSEQGLRGAGREQPWATVIPQTGAVVYIDQRRAGRYHIRIAHQGETTQRIMGRRALATLLGLAPTGVTVGMSVVPRLPLDRIRLTPHAHPLRRLLRFASLERADISLALVYGIFVALASLAVPISVQSLVNTVAFGNVLLPVAVLTFIVAGVLALGALTRALQAYIVEQIQQRMFVRGLLDFTTRLLDAHPSTTRHIGVADLTTRFLEIPTIQKTASVLILDGFDLTLKVVVGLTLLAFYHPTLMLFAGAIALALAAVVFLGGLGAFDTAHDESVAKYAAVYSLEGVVRAHEPLRTGAGRAFALAKAEALARRYREARGQHFRKVLRQLVGSSLVQVIGAAALLGVGAVLVIRAQLTLGQLVASELVFATISAAIVKLHKQLEAAYDAATSVEKLAGALEIPPASTAGELLHGTGPMAVELQEACLSHQDGQLAQGSLIIPAGDRVCLTASAGEGQTLLCELLGASRAPSSGTIRYDGVDSRLLDAVEVQSQIALVADPAFIEDTILANLRLCAPHADLAAVSKVIDVVGLSPVITRLPDGLATVLVRSGRPLSRTQLWRLALARALLARPRFLVLDGVLDHLGLVGEARQQALDAVFSTTATIFVVSYAPDVVSRCHREYRLRAGVLQENA